MDLGQFQRPASPGGHALRLPQSTSVGRKRYQPPPLALSRRRFVELTAGAAAVGAGFGVGLTRPGRVDAHGNHQPQPIPGGSPLLVELAGRSFHVYGPGAEGFDPPDAEPATITDFDGTVGLAYISGMVRRTNVATGEVRELPFRDNDMRFMHGAFVSVDGQVHRGAFAFI